MLPAIEAPEIRSFPHLRGLVLRALLPARRMRFEFGTSGFSSRQLWGQFAFARNSAPYTQLLGHMGHDLALKTDALARRHEAGRALRDGPR